MRFDSSLARLEVALGVVEPRPRDLAGEDFTTKTDYFGKVGGKHASECGGATNTRSNTRFSPRFVGKVYSLSINRSDESFWGAVKRFSSQLQNSRFALTIQIANLYHYHRGCHHAIVGISCQAGTFSYSRT